MSVRTPCDSDAGSSRSFIDVKSDLDAEIDLVINKLSPNTRLFLQLLSGIWCKAVPYQLFQRACQPRYYWHTDGTLLESRWVESLIPSWLYEVVSRYERGHNTLLEELNKADPSNLVLQIRSDEPPGLTLSSNARQKLHNDLPKANKIQLQITILKIVAHSFPEPYTDIVWQDTHARLWGVIDSTCIPFLNAIDIPSFVSSLESTSLACVRNLFSLVNCVTAFTPDQCLRTLSHDIHVRLMPLYSDSSDDGYYQLLSFLSVHEDILNRSSYMGEYGRLLQSVSQPSRSTSRRYRAALGLATAVYSGHRGDGLTLQIVQEFYNHWTPRTSPRADISEMEWLAYLPRIRHLMCRPSGTNSQSNSIVLALAAFSEAKSENYEEACTLLSAALPEVKQLYGASARETLVVATAYLNTSNILCKEVSGLDLVSKHCSMQLESSEPSAESCAIKIALADSFIGCSDYLRARALLVQAYQCTDITHADVVKIRLRELGMCRRSTMSNTPMDTERMLHDLVSLVDAVPEETQHAIMKELWCTTSTFRKARYPEIKRLFEDFLYRLCTSVIATSTAYVECGWRPERLKACFEELIQGRLPAISDVVESRRIPKERIHSLGEHRERYRAAFETLLGKIDNMRSGKTDEGTKRSSPVLDERPQSRPTSKNNHISGLEDHDNLDANVDVHLPAAGDTAELASLEHERGVPDSIDPPIEAHSRCSCPAFLKESVLTLDGGGMRGYASLLILNELMKEVLRIEHELDDTLDQALNDQSSPTSRHRDNQLPLPCHYFNYVFGTSTGGIIALLLGRMRLSVGQCLNIYREMGTEVFRKKRMFGLKFHQYSHKRMERLIKKAIRENFRALDVENQVIGQNQPETSNRRVFTDLTFMQDLQEYPTIGSDDGEEEEEDLDDLENLSLFDDQSRLGRQETEHLGLEECRVGLVATRRGETTHLPHLFRSYYNPTRLAPARNQTLEETDTVKVLNLDKQDSPTRRIKIWEAARATSAAPHYFKRIRVDFTEYMDGGLVANNPSWHAWYEASSMHVDNPWGCRSQQGCIRFLVSIGTGKGASRNLFTGDSMFDQIRGLAIDKLTDPEDVHESMSNMVNQLYPGAGIYSRFNVTTALRKMKLDECKKKDQTFKEISKAVQSYLRPRTQPRNQLNALARQLVYHRRSKCRAQHQRYEGLSTPGPIDPTFSSRFLTLDDIQRIIHVSGPDIPVALSASNRNAPSFPDTGYKAQERDLATASPQTKTTTPRRLSWDKKKEAGGDKKEAGNKKEAIYVYDYNKDEIKRVEDGDEFKTQIGDHKIKAVPIPLKPGRLPIRVQGPENVAALVKVSAGLRFWRMIGAQNILYVVGSVGPVVN